MPAAAPLRAPTGTIWSFWSIEEIAEESPVILLDDVMSELDSRRRSYLLNKIQGRQVFVTCCDQESVDLLEQGQAFYMEKGCIIPKNTKTGQ